MRELMPTAANRNGPLIVIQTLALVFAVVAGLTVSEWQVLPLPIQLPRAALIALVFLATTLPILLSSWRLSLVALFVWLVIEDLVRKLAGNDIAIYFIKDAFYIVFLTGFALDPTVRGSWRSATASTRVALYVMIGWAALMSIPTMLLDWRLPLAGLRLDFFYVPLVAAGFMLVQDRAKLSRMLLTLAIVGGVSCAIGCIQAVIGPSFLAPDVATPGLKLDLVRGLPGQEAVYRPTGTFVDAGRFDSMAVVTLVVCLISLAAVRGTARLIVAACLISSIMAVWVSGGRTYLIWGAALVAAAVLPSLVKSTASAARGRRRWAVAVVAGLVGVGLVAMIAPDLYLGRVSWYTATLDPRSADNEWNFRWTSYSGDVIRSFQLGGLIGSGTGQESLGKQYLFGEDDSSGAGLHQVEGGYAAVVVEWGVLGVLLWIAWTVAWTVRQARMIGVTRDGPLPTVGPVVVVWTAFFLFIGFVAGYQIFQNYIANAYFWLFSGLLFGAAAVARTKKVEQTEESPLAA